MDIQLIAYDNEIEIATNLIIQFWQEHNHFTPSYEDACENLRSGQKRVIFCILSVLTTNI